MPARIHKARHDEWTKTRIKVGNILNRLHKFIEGKVEMQPHQVTAALGLLKKAMPDMTSVNHSGEISARYHISDEPLSPDQWADKYAATEDNLAAPTGTTSSTH